MSHTHTHSLFSSLAQTKGLTVSLITKHSVSNTLLLLSVKTQSKVEVKAADFTSILQFLILAQLLREVLQKAVEDLQQVPDGLVVSSNDVLTYSTDGRWLGLKTTQEDTTTSTK